MRLDVVAPVASRDGQLDWSFLLPSRLEATKIPRSAASAVSSSWPDRLWCRVRMHSGAFLVPGVVKLAPSDGPTRAGGRAMLDHAGASLPVLCTISLAQPRRRSVISSPRAAKESPSRQQKSCTDSPSSPLLPFTVSCPHGQRGRHPAFLRLLSARGTTTRDCRASRRARSCSRAMENLKSAGVRDMCMRRLAPASSRFSRALPPTRLCSCLVLRIARRSPYLEPAGRTLAHRAWTRSALPSSPFSLQPSRSPSLAQRNDIDVADTHGTRRTPPRLHWGACPGVAPSQTCLKGGSHSRRQAGRQAGGRAVGRESGRPPLSEQWERPSSPGPSGRRLLGRRGKGREEGLACARWPV